MVLDAIICTECVFNDFHCERADVLMAKYIVHAHPLAIFDFPFTYPVDKYERIVTIRQHWNSMTTGKVLSDFDVAKRIDIRRFGHFFYGNVSF